jgi:hypothetical protein
MISYLFSPDQLTAFFVISHLPAVLFPALY